MASIINASSSGSGGIVQTADASGVLQLQSNGTVAVNIASGGAVGIGGITNPTFPLVVQTSGTSTAVAGNVIARLQSTSTGYDATLQFSDNITNSGFISMNSGNMIVGSYGTESIRFKSGGTVILQNGSTSATGIGITFPATQYASSDANTLDDYEEGTWTPNFQNNGSTSNWSSKVGRYVKIGQLVTVWFYNGGGGSSNGGSGSGAVILNNLPFSMTYGATLANQQAIAVTGGSNTNQPGLDWLSTNGGTGTGAQVVYNVAGNQEQGNLTYVAGVWTYLTST